MTKEQRKIINQLKRELKPYLSKFVGDPVDNKIVTSFRKIIEDAVENIPQRNLISIDKVETDPDNPYTIKATLTLPGWLAAQVDPEQYAEKYMKEKLCPKKKIKKSKN